MTIDSTFMIFALAFGVAMLVLGIMTKVKVFNIIAVCIFIFIASQISDQPALFIGCLGLIVFELWDAFFYRRE